LTVRQAPSLLEAFEGFSMFEVILAALIVLSVGVLAVHAFDAFRS